MYVQSNDLASWGTGFELIAAFTYRLQWVLNRHDWLAVTWHRSGRRTERVQVRFFLSFFLVSYIILYSFELLIRMLQSARWCQRREGGRSTETREIWDIFRIKREVSPDRSCSAPTWPRRKTRCISDGNKGETRCTLTKVRYGYFLSLKTITIYITHQATGFSAEQRFARYWGSAREIVSFPFFCPLTRVTQWSTSFLFSSFSLMKTTIMPRSVARRARRGDSRCERNFATTVRSRRVTRINWNDGSGNRALHHRVVANSPQGVGPDATSGTYVGRKLIRIMTMSHSTANTRATKCPRRFRVGQ